MDLLKCVAKLHKNDSVANKPNEKPKKEITKAEKIGKLKNDNKIRCYSKTTSNIPDPIENFDELKTLYVIPEEVFNAFNKMSYSKPTPVQMQVLPIMIDRHNVLISAPTGSGKTMAFLLPLYYDFLNNKSNASERPLHSIIVCPTIELAKQIFEEFLCIINEIKEADRKPKILFLTKKNKDKIKADIIVSTPLRMKNLIERDNTGVDLSKLRWLVIDESDKMMDDADSVNSFTEQLNSIYDECNKASDQLKVGLFSATQSNPVWDWSKNKLLDDLIYVRVGNLGSAALTIKQELHYCSTENLKYFELQSMFTNGNLKIPCLIFVDRSEDVYFLYNLLQKCAEKSFIKIDMINAEMTNEQRKESVNNFRIGSTYYLICTNVLARGIDFKGVSTVVNYDLPLNKNDYIHRIGRCGRAGENGLAVNLWTDNDVNGGLLDVLKTMRASGQPNDELEKLVKSKQKSNKSKDFRLKKLKRKYKDDETGETKQMKTIDKKKKKCIESIVKRKRSLRKTYVANMTDKFE